MRSKLLFILLLWGFYVGLTESFSVLNILTGLVLAIICVLFTQKFIPLPAITDVNLTRIFYWPLWVIVQVYIAGISVVKAIIFGGKVSIVEVETKLSSETLRIMLSRSMTLTPGTIFLSLRDNKIVVLWLRQKTDPEITNQQELNDAILASLENILMKAQV